VTACVKLTRRWRGTAAAAAILSVNEKRTWFEVGASRVKRQKQQVRKEQRRHRTLYDNDVRHQIPTTWRHFSIEMKHSYTNALANYSCPFTAVKVLEKTGEDRCIMQSQRQ